MKKSKTIENSLPIKASDNANDAKIAQAVTIIDKKLESLGGANNYIYKTSSVPSPFRTDTSINIGVITDINLLFALMNHFENLLDFMAQSKKHYNTTLVNSWFGHIIENILCDIDNRVKTLVNSTSIAELLKSKQDLQGFKSSEQRLFDTLLTVDKLLKS